MIRVLLAEHQPLILLGMRAALAEAADVEVAAEARSGPEAIRLFTELNPDVTILGLRFPGSCSIDDLDSYFVITPRARVVVLADHAGDAEITKALKKGVAGYICKDIAPGELVNAVRSVASGRKYIPDEIAGILSQHIGDEELTPTETSVLQKLVGGMSNKEIAFALDISENTVKTHVANIFGKIGVSDRTSAATTAIRRGLVRVDI